MLIPAEIQQFEEIPPKKEGDTPLFRIVAIDKSLPAAARCATPLELFLGAEKRKKLPEGDLTDCKVTLVITEMKQGRVGIQCKGDIAVTVHGQQKSAPPAGAKVEPAGATK